MIKFHKVTTDANIPARSTEGAAGFDLYANSMHTLSPRNRVAVNTGITVEFGPEYAGIIKPRSGIAVRHGIDVLAGVVDSDYRGEVRVCLINHGNDEFVISPGDRIAQIVFCKIDTDAHESSGNLSETERGAKGFGSTGT